MKKTTLSKYIKRRKPASFDNDQQNENEEKYFSVEQSDEEDQEIQNEKIGEEPELYEKLSKEEYQKFLEENGIDLESAKIQTSHIYDGPETFDEDFKAENLLFTGQLPTVLPITPWDDKTSKIPTGKDAIFQDLLNKYKEKQNE